MLRKEKGAANLFAYLLYIFVSLAILGVIVFSVQGTIQRNQERYNFDEMIKSIDLIYNTLNEVSKSRFSVRQIDIYNPDFIEIDCVDNQIRGEVTFNQELRDDIDLFIKDVQIIKNNGKVSFNKIINFSDDIDINCNHVSMLTGKSTYIFSYVDYNAAERQINISIKPLDVNKTDTTETLDIMHLSIANNDFFNVGETVTFLVIPTNNSGPYNCTWVSSIDGLLGSECSIEVENLSPGEHNIYLTITDLISTKNQNISIFVSGPTGRSLVLNKTGTGEGTVTSSPSGIDCGSTCSYDFEDSTSVTLTANPALGNTFTGWSGEGCSGTGTCVVTMDQNREVTANFNISTFNLSVTKTGAGEGTVTSSPSGIDCGLSCLVSYDYGTNVTLTATPDTGYIFTGWSGEGCSGTGDCNVSMTQARDINAEFDIDNCALTLNNIPTDAGLIYTTYESGDVYAEGGEVSNILIDDQWYRIHAFKDVGASTFTVYENLDVNVLIIAGGGGGGSRVGGGGGAGGLIIDSLSVTPQSYSVIVGNGGVGAPSGSDTAYQGEDSSVFGMTAIGGGGGGGSTNTTRTAGGSGGGWRGNSNGPGGTFIEGQGNKGGSNGSSRGGAGGGGAGGPGEDGKSPAYNPGAGGAGLYYGDLFGDLFGENGWFAGGGGGGGDNDGTEKFLGGLGGIGGGGKGSDLHTEQGENGLANTGGGGGSGAFSGSTNSKGGSGGSGIILIRYLIPFEEISCGDSITLTAVPNTLYSFEKWTNLSGTLLSTNNPYIFTILNSMTINANYILPEYTINLFKNPSDGGYVSGSGTFEYGESVTITATPETDYAFVSWTDELYNVVSTDINYTFNMPGEDKNFTANFTSSDIIVNGLILHLDANSITGLNDGDKVSEWLDLSGYYNNAIQSNESNMPIFKTNILNGKPVVRGNGTSQSLNFTSNIENSGDLTYFIIGNITNDGFFLGGEGSGTNAKFGRWSSNLFLRLIPGGSSDTSISWSFGDNYTLFNIIRDVNNKVDVKINGGSKTRLYGDALITGTASISYIFRGDVSSQYIAGDIAEIMVYNRALLDTEIEQVENYLLDKWIN